ncbi:MFS transporter, MHS family, proline/betaine transporter [Pseudovibrio denitrificans]|uniref:MFS transporter, MHS family, proline/betaine transporter n=1 Tax=Pseudovibrio denitrificans TaxID=258256 RepID=A0A1I7AH84_9HYPH|nr:MFS transporter [Pseudovibrio denitrificans]SFT74223.1 MFS transporter, MHS family, proline/betaine transporter [Pseudovibrio denitrificans]
MSGSQQRLPPRSIIAAASGNVLEWYDFTVYGFLTATLATQFFPLENRVASVLSTFAVLAVGYAARPIGSVIFGHIGDRVGRKAAMMISVLLMGGGSLAIALLPTFHQIGITAAVLLVLIRIIQGIAVAGEYTASGVLLVEQAEPERRALTGAWIACAMISGCLIGSAVPAGISLLLTADQMADWGWRVAFAFGTLVALFSAIIRRHITDTVLVKNQSDQGSPVWQSLRDHSALIGQMILLLIPTAVIYFVIYVYAVSYLSADPNFGSSAALNVTTLNLVVMALFIPVCGLAADRFGLRPAFLAGAVATFILAGPCWWLMLRPDTASVFLGQFGLTLTSTVGWALSITALTLMAPDHLRCSVVALGYNLSMALFGGTTPIVATYLVNQTGRDYAPVYYILLAVLVSIPIIWRLPKLIATTRLKNALA